MACFVGEEDVWQCLQHPSMRRRTGVCPTCLRQRLVKLCPECAGTRPCSCYPIPPDSVSTSSSSSSSFSLFQFPSASSRHDSFMSSTAVGESGRVSTLIDRELAFRKSRSLVIPILQSTKTLPHVGWSKVNLWSVFKVSKTKKCDLPDDESNKRDVSGATEDFSKMMRSRSVAVDAGDSFSPVTAKRRGWYLPSPIKAFRQSKTSKLQLHERSPMHRG